MSNLAAQTVLLPILPLKNSVLFPLQAMPLAVGRDQSRAAVEGALATEDKALIVVAQKDAAIAEPVLADLYPMGTRAVVKRMVPAENVLQIIVQGVERVSLEPAEEDGAPYLRSHATDILRPTDWSAETEAMRREVLDLAGNILERINPQAKAALSQMLDQVETPLQQVYVLSSLLSLDTEKEQQLLAAGTHAEAFELLHNHLAHEVQVLAVRQQIASQAQSEMSREQREYLLRKQLRAIQDELGEESPQQADIVELKRKLDEAQLPESLQPEAERELARLERLPTASPDYQLTRSYIEFIAELPWNKLTEDVLDLHRARRILDEDHHGLDKVKQRIIEHLAVLRLNPRAKAPILCFIGPPGVGKTSLGQSIARSLGRKFERLSLGGVSDEAELRGHRRTYIGAMPGRIIQAIRRAKVNNPLIMLDEIDKLGRDFRGDPAAALLEILDPAQNVAFRDNYLDMPYDLSRVLFIATANALDTVPGPLLDRMEIIRIAGYSDTEKLHIARKFLTPRQLEEAGLPADKVDMPDTTIEYLIRHYTREAGVRELERAIGSICRKVATRFAEGETNSVTIGNELLVEMLGPEPYLGIDTRQNLQPGVTPGLAWTPVGGEVLYVEAVALPDSKELTLTGQLGSVMQESARTAQSYIRSQWAELDIDKQALSGGVHLHVPAGATPKDGPSAGVTMATALASLYTYLPVRSDTAMTGEITLTGIVLPVGGIKEKILAAHRAGIRRVILPAQNRKDLADIPEPVRQDIEFVFVEHVQEALGEAIPRLANRLVHAR